MKIDAGDTEKSHHMSAGSSNSILIRDVRLLDPATNFDGKTHVGIRDGRIDHLDARAPTATYTETVHAAGLWLMPGVIDLCARLQEPGAVHRATVLSETSAALGAGITTLCVPPDTTPVIDNVAVVEYIRMLSGDAGGASISMLGALTHSLDGRTLSEMSGLKRAGCVGVSNAMSPLVNLLVARRALDYAAGHDLTTHIIPQDPILTNGGCAHDGPVALRLGLRPIPVAAETVALSQWLSLIEDTYSTIHFGRLSSARGVELVADAKARGLPVTCDVAAHQLFLTEDDIGDFNTCCHVLPPLRSLADREALRKGVSNGVIDAICSDHQPHEGGAKARPFPLSEAGMSTMETLLPLSIQLVDQEVLTPLQMAAMLTTKPAGILGLAPPSVKVGDTPDLLLLDPKTTWNVEPGCLRSSGHNTPWFGRQMRGRALRVFRGGRGGL